MAAATAVAAAATGAAAAAIAADAAAIAVVVAAAAAAAGVASVNLDRFQSELTPRRVMLPGGAVFLSVPVPAAQAMSFGVWLRRGSASEPVGQEGVTHFLEHIVFKGTATRSSLEVAEAFDAVGAMVDAFTTKDYVAFTLRVLPEFFSTALAVLADMVLRPALEPEAVLLEQDVICEEIQEALDTPEDRLHDAYASYLYGPRGRGRPILGSPESVRAATPESLRAAHQALFAGPNVVLAVGGNLAVGVEDEILAAFDGLVPAATPFADVATDPPGERAAGELVIESPILQTYFEIGNRAVAAGHPDRVPVLLVSNLLGGGMSSRIFQAVREREGLAYTVYNYTDIGRDGGLVSCAGSCSPDKEARVREVVAAEYRRLLAEGPTADELASNKAQIKSHLVFALEGAHNQMSRAAKNELYFGRFMPLAELVAQVDAVDREVVMRCAADWFDPDRMVFAAHRPAKTRRQRPRT
ncbi:MAG: pitrilysin family protein [Candidatus Krumholzibacteriia bacterium]